MGTSRQTMDFLLDQLDRALPITTRKMFGEYCVYWDGKPVAIVCDDQLFVKPTEAGRACRTRWWKVHLIRGRRCICWWGRIFGRIGSGWGSC